MKNPSAKERRVHISVILAITISIILFCGCGAVVAATQDMDEDAAETELMTEEEEIGDIDPLEQPDMEEPVEINAAANRTSGDQNSRTDKPPKVKGLKASAGYKKVFLEWKTVDKPAKGDDVTVWYRVYRNGRLINKVQDKGNKSKIRKTYTAKEGSVSSYAVKAVYRKSNGKLVQGKKSKAVKCGAVRPIKYKFTTTTRAPYYTTYKGFRVGGHLKKGKRYTSNGGKNGRYNIKVKGKTRWLPLKYTKNRSAEYVNGKKKYYSKQEAENYVNGRKLTSKTKYLIWVSAYGQRVYLFKKSGGKWDCKSSYLCATGGMSAPSPAGKLKIWSRLYFNHGLYYWSNFYSITAMHETPSSSIGYPSSTGGCVRMYKDSAKYIYEHVPINTTVLIF